MPTGIQRTIYPGCVSHVLGWHILDLAGQGCPRAAGKLFKKVGSEAPHLFGRVSRQA